MMECDGFFPAHLRENLSSQDVGFSLVYAALWYVCAYLMYVGCLQRRIKVLRQIQFLVFVPAHNRHATKCSAERHVLGKAQQIPPIIIIIVIKVRTHDDFNSRAEELKRFFIIFCRRQYFVPVAAELVVDEAVPIREENLTPDSCIQQVVYFEA